MKPKKPCTQRKIVRASRPGYVPPSQPPREGSMAGKPSGLSTWRRAWAGSVAWLVTLRRSVPVQGVKGRLCALSAARPRTTSSLAALAVACGTNPGIKRSGRATFTAAGIPLLIQLWTRCWPPTLGRLRISATFAGPPRSLISFRSACMSIPQLNVVFNKKSIMTFNNTMFGRETICVMQMLHESVERLYAAAKELRDVTGQSAVARLLNVTPQVVKNWEARGISSDGALLAQKKIGCNANWLLEGVPKAQDQGYDLPRPIARPPVAQEYVRDTHWNNRANQSWPFKRVSVQDLSQLTDAERHHVEEGILFMLGSKDKSEKQPGPGTSNRAA